MNEVITVVVSGPTNSGKSIVRDFIFQKLAEAGINASAQCREEISMPLGENKAHLTKVLKDNNVVVRVCEVHSEQIPSLEAEIERHKSRDIHYTGEQSS